jgi:hypothetical protein
MQTSIKTTTPMQIPMKTPTLVQTLVKTQMHDVTKNPMHTRRQTLKLINKGFGNVRNGGTRNIVNTRIKLN